MRAKYIIDSAMNDPMPAIDCWQEKVTDWQEKPAGDCAASELELQNPEEHFFLYAQQHEWSDVYEKGTDYGEKHAGVCPFINTNLCVEAVFVSAFVSVFASVFLIDYG